MYFFYKENVARKRENYIYIYRAQKKKNIYGINGCECTMWCGGIK